MSIVDKSGIYYTIYEDHVYVGNPNKDRPNAVVDGAEINTINILSEVEGKPVTGVLTYAFYGYKKSQSIKFADSIKIIEDHAFDTMSMDFGDELQLPTNVEYIGIRAFATSKFKTVHISDKVSYIGSSAFGSNSKLENIIIDPANQHFVVTDDKCLYDYMKTRLIQAPIKIESMKFPQTLVYMESYAITDASVTELVFPVTFSKMSSYSIISCSKLVTISFLGNLIDIGSNAFSQCNQLQNIYYYGTVYVQFKFFTSDTAKIRICSGYKWDSFATYTNIIKEGACPSINYIRYKTIYISNSYTFLIRFSLFILLK